MAEVIDLVEYKLKRFVDSFYQGSRDWEIAMQIFMLYLEGEITIRWGEGGIFIKHIDSDLNLKEVFVPGGVTFMEEQ